MNDQITKKITHIFSPQMSAGIFRVVQRYSISFDQRELYFPPQIFADLLRRFPLIFFSP